MTATWDTYIFAVQDRTGTVAQLTTEGTENPVEVGDTGVYNGRDWNGQEQALDFTVGAVNDPYNFCITTMTPTGGPGNFLASAWPADGFITWLTGANISESPAETVVIARNIANAYCTADFFQQYHLSRGNTYPASPFEGILQAIVRATDYLDQRYRFKGVKLFQFLSDNPAYDPVIGFLDQWLASFGFLGGGPGTNYQGWFTPSSSFQHTEWPRQGCVDYNGDTVWGVPLVIQQATAEAALRSLNGINLQPDYDPTVVTGGAVVSSLTQEIGPLKKTVSYDTKLGLSFFPTIPHIDRMLRTAGLLVGGGGRSLIR
jgi:hypothetical protein